MSYQSAAYAFDNMEPPCDEDEEILAAEEDLRTERQIEAWEDER